MDELTGHRVYGANHDDPHAGPRPGQTYAEPVGGLLLELQICLQG